MDGNVLAGSIPAFRTKPNMVYNNMNTKIDKEEKIKLVEEARELVFQLSETQDRVYTNLINIMGEEFDSDDPLWDYVYNGGEYAKKLFINTLK